MNSKNTDKMGKIYNENCLETMSRMPDGFIDLTVTSPPYDNLREYNGYSFPFEQIADELYRVTKEGGVVVWVVGDATIDGSETGTSFKQALYFKKIGFNIHDTMIYCSDSPPRKQPRYEQSFEYMFVFSKGKPNTFNRIKRFTKQSGKSRKSTTFRSDGKTLSPAEFSNTVLAETTINNVWFYYSGYKKTTKDDVAFNHPAIFPEKLARDHIYSWSNEGDIVYDPFCGSGTTPKMAHLLKRKWIASEISKEYVELAEKRLHPYLTQRTLAL